MIHQAMHLWYKCISIMHHTIMFPQGLLCARRLPPAMTDHSHQERGERYLLFIPAAAVSRPDSPNQETAEINLTISHLFLQRHEDDISQTHVSPFHGKPRVDKSSRNPQSPTTFAANSRFSTTLHCRVARLPPSTAALVR